MKTVSTESHQIFRQENQSFKATKGAETNFLILKSKNLKKGKMITCKQRPNRNVNYVYKKGNT